MNERICLENFGYQLNLSMHGKTKVSIRLQVVDDVLGSSLTSIYTIIKSYFIGKTILLTSTSIKVELI